MDADVSSLDEPDSLLNRLASESGLADPLCSRSEWCLSYHEVFAPDRTVHLRSSDDSVLTFAEIAHPTIGPLLEPLEAHWFFSRPLLGPSSGELLRELLSDLARSGVRPCVAVSGMDLDSPLLAQLLKAFSNTYEVGCLEPIVFRSASLENGPEGFLSRRTRKFRSNLRRAVTKGGDAGLKFTRYVATTPEEAESGFRRMAAIERTSWKGIENCGMTEEPFCSFYEKVYTRMCRNHCGLAIFAQHEGKDVGFVMGGVDGICYRGQQFSFEHEWAPYSVGNLLQWEMIQWLCELGIQRYDMGSVLEYKVHWAEIEALSHTLVWRRL